MIIARAQTERGGEVLIIGLSRENIRRLVEGDPIKMSQKSHGKGVPEGWNIMIMFGETELTMTRQFEEAGVITNETQIKIDPRLGD